MGMSILKRVGAKLPIDGLAAAKVSIRPDFFGYMVATGESVVIEKGFTTANEMVRSLESRIDDTRNHVVVFHLCKIKGGVVSRTNCGPFPVIDDVSVMRGNFYESDSGASITSVDGVIYHGGINDSQRIIKDVMSNISPEELSNNSKIDKFFSLIIGNKSAIILRKDGWFLLFGKFAEDRRRGVVFSNNLPKDYCFALDN